MPAHPNHDKGFAMNALHDLLHRYAAADGYTVNDREWLMLLEIDPIRAAHAITHLAILAAEDLALRYATEALDAIIAASRRADASASASHTAAAEIAAFTERITAARSRTAAIWTGTVVALLRDADILHAAARPAAPHCPPRTWADTTVRLPGTDRTYPARVATRRRRCGQPIVGFDTDTCRRIATDLGHHPATGSASRPPLILADRDRPILVLGAADLEDAWQAGARIVHPDRDGFYHLGDAWAFPLAPRRTAPRRTSPARPPSAHRPCSCCACHRSASRGMRPRLTGRPANQRTAHPPSRSSAAAATCRWAARSRRRCG